MTTNEIKLFLRFLKEKNFYSKYKEYFYDENIGVHCRMRNYKDFYKDINTIEKYLKWCEIEKVFNGFWWVSGNFNCYDKLYFLRNQWLIYLGEE